MRRWPAVRPALLGLTLIAVGIVLVLGPNWTTAQIEFDRAWAGHVTARDPDSNVFDVTAAVLFAIGVTVVRTFGVAVVQHPILTVFFGLGSILLGIFVVVEYGIVKPGRQGKR